MFPNMLLHSIGLEFTKSYVLTNETASCSLTKVKFIPTCVYVSWCWGEQSVTRSSCDWTCGRHLPVPRCLSQEWVPIIRHDMLSQRKIKAQPPLSDAYLHGMPAKRRKVSDVRRCRCFCCVQALRCKHSRDTFRTHLRSSHSRQCLGWVVLMHPHCANSVNMNVSWPQWGAHLSDWVKTTTYMCLFTCWTERQIWSLKCILKLVWIVTELVKVTAHECLYSSSCPPLT